MLIKSSGEPLLPKASYTKKAEQRGGFRKRGKYKEEVRRNKIKENKDK